MLDVKECKGYLKQILMEDEDKEYLDSIIYYLDEYEKLRIEKSWTESPERMGK
jgi:hypothetical protein